MCLVINVVSFVLFSSVLIGVIVICGLICVRVLWVDFIFGCLIVVLLCSVWCCRFESEIVLKLSSVRLLILVFVRYCEVV